MEALAKNVTIRLPNGASLEVPSGTTVREVAERIGPRLAKDAVAGKLDGRIVDLVTRLESDGAIEIVTWKSPDAVPIYRHSTAHLTAQAVKRLFPEVQIGIGPPIENGYYYDFLPARPFTPEDLEKIEAEMRRIIAEDLPIERSEMPVDEAVTIFEGQKDPLKVQIARELPEGERVSCYRQGEFIDLCRGPHVASTGRLGVFKLTHAAGAYWKGDEKNPMLQRIYGASFLTQKELDLYLQRLEDAKARDHRKLGRELGLVTFHPLAPASPFFLPKGASLYNGLLSYLREEYARRGYSEVITPQIFDADLFRISGHYDNYRDNMYFTEIDEREFGVKPMNCPGHHLLFKEGHWSYRELPVRFADFGRLHRYERSGVTAGLTRVRTFSQDDSHIYVAVDQVESEVHAFVEFLDSVYSTFGFDEVDISVGLRPPNRMGSDENWDRSESALVSALEAIGRPYSLTPGDGNFYGPKIDFRVKDAIGRPLAARHDPVRLGAAGKLRPDVHRRGWEASPAGRAPSSDPGLGRAVPRDPDRAHRREPSRSGSLPCRRSCSRCPTASPTPRGRPSGSSPRAACGSRSTSATRSSGRGSARRSSRRSLRCSWSGRRKRRPAPLRFDCGTAATPGR